MLGIKLRDLREINGIVQHQISALLEVDNAFIGKAEKKRRKLVKPILGDFINYLKSQKVN